MSSNSDGFEGDTIIVAVDIGSSTINCTAYEYHEANDGSSPPFSVKNIHGGCSATTAMRSVHPNTGTLDRGTMSTIEIIFSMVLRQLERKYEEKKKIYRIAAVGFSSLVMNLVAVDSETGKLLGEDFTCTYACNSPEVVQECQRIRSELSIEDLQALYQATGAPLHTSYAIPQLCALYHRQQQHLTGKRKRESGDKKVEMKDVTWQTLASHCIAKWTGRKVLPISYSEASWTGLLNIDSCTYDESALALLPKECIESLPKLADYTDCVEGVPENSYWWSFPQLRRAKFFLGIGDGACANVGSKCTTANRIAVTIGTSAAARMCIPHPMGAADVRTKASSTPFHIPQHQGLFCYRIDKDHVLVGGALTDGGSIIEWARDIMNLVGDDDFEAMVKRVKALGERELEEQSKASPSETNQNRNSNLLVVPFFSGERSTGFRGGATGAMLGLTRETTRDMLLQSCFEGVSFRLKAILDLIVACRLDSGEGKPCIIGSGHAMDVNDYWRQMISDISNLRVIFDSDTKQGTSRGVAQLVAMGLKGCSISSFEEEISPTKTSDPRPVATAMYQRKADQQSTFIDSISPLYSE